MKDLKFFNKFYIDKEKDIQVHLFKSKDADELVYYVKTPYHKTGNLMRNLAAICNVETEKDENDMLTIKGVIPASINGDNEEVYIFRLGGMKIANIYNDRIEVKAKIPAISKTLMSQTKNYEMDLSHTIVKSYIFKKSKFRTDLHTHMNANLEPDVLIALGIKFQINYPLYYIKKLGIKLTKEQEEAILERRKVEEEEYKDSLLTGKYLTRKIDDNTFINFADLIFGNLKDAEENISKIRISLSILKDGQAVFTNLEKLYLYRYVFCKPTFNKDKYKLTKKMVESLPDTDVRNYLLKMLEDKKKESPYRNNSFKQDKYLWIGRSYQRQGIFYVEITDTDLVKNGDIPIKLLEEIHEVMPKIEKETGVKIRFLAGLRRIPLTIVKNQKTSANYLRENLNVLKAVAHSPYIVGSDFIGEEINDISELKPVFKELVQYAVKEDPGFTIRVHAGENDSCRQNIQKSIECIITSLEKGQKCPRFRLGHGLYTPDLDSEEGKALICLMKRTNAIVEFQLTSNVRLNNLTSLDKHPIKRYLKEGIRCVQGTDGCGLYGTDTVDEQLALSNLLNVTEEEFASMRKVEDEIMTFNDKYFKKKAKKFEKLTCSSSIRDVIYDLEEKYNKKASNIELRINNKLDSEEELRDKIKTLPVDKVPVVIAGGSFNSKGRVTETNEDTMKVIKKLVEELDDKKVYFVVGHKMEGYEKAVIDLSKQLNKKFEIDAIIPKKVSPEEKDQLLNEKNIAGVCVSTENEELGIYKSFNYEIFERRKAIVVALDGNSPVSNLVQEAKNGKGKSKIYVNSNVDVLSEKAKSLEGYVVEFKPDEEIVEKIIEENPELK